MQRGLGRLAVEGWAVFALLATSTAAQAQPAAISPTVQRQVKAAQSMLAALAVKPLSARPYNRTRDFGAAWVDVDGNGCDTRNDILARDLTATSVAADCRVLKGTLLDRYTGQKLSFVRGPRSADVPIDHIVPLHLAWQLGAASWPQGKRVTFANDPLNLIATDRSSNSVKSDSGPDEWLPAATGYRCTYVIKFVRVARLYRLAVTASMKSAMAGVLRSCRTVVGSPANASALPPAVWSRAANL